MDARQHHVTSVKIRSYMDSHEHDGSAYEVMAVEMTLANDEMSEVTIFSETGRLNVDYKSPSQNREKYDAE